MAIASFISQRNCATKLAKRLFETLIELNKLADVILAGPSQGLKFWGS